ncbi:hypothetical protein MRX96_049747 [Rhipicephalus microplus]
MLVEEGDDDSSVASSPFDDGGFLDSLDSVGGAAGDCLESSSAAVSAVVEGHPFSPRAPAAATATTEATTAPYEWVRQCVGYVYNPREAHRRKEQARIAKAIASKVKQEPSDDQELEAQSTSASPRSKYTCIAEPTAASAVTSPPPLQLRRWATTATLASTQADARATPTGRSTAAAPSTTSAGPVARPYCFFDASARTMGWFFDQTAQAAAAHMTVGVAAAPVLCWPVIAAAAPPALAPPLPYLLPVAVAPAMVGPHFALPGPQMQLPRPEVPARPGPVQFFYMMQASYLTPFRCCSCWPDPRYN